MNNKIPESVYKLVVAEVGDYERKKHLLEDGKLPRESIMVYTKSVCAIESALLSVCEGECTEARDALRSDIALGRGFKNGAAKQYYATRGTYIRRKRQAVNIIARALGLI